MSAAVASTLTKNFSESLRTKLPSSQQSKAKRALQEIWTAETKKDALTAFDAFVKTWAVKYDKAVECLTKDRDALLVFYDFPAEHWKHLRTTNVI
jgi:transposase-like protein